MTSLEPQYQAYLQKYLDTLPPDAPQRTAPTDACQFGDFPELADELGGLIVAGTKTATCGAVWAYEAEGSPLPTAGLLTVVLAGNWDPLCVIETTEAVDPALRRGGCAVCVRGGGRRPDLGVVAPRALEVLLTSAPARLWAAAGGAHAAGLRTLSGGVSLSDSIGGSQPQARRTRIGVGELKGGWRVAGNLALRRA